MREDIVDLVRRFLELVRGDTGSAGDAAKFLDLSPGDAQALRNLGDEQAVMLAESGTFIFRVRLDGKSRKSPSLSAYPELAGIVHDYLFVVRGLVKAKPQTAHIVLGIPASEARRLASMSLAEIREATETGRWRLVLPKNLAKLVRVYFHLGTEPQRRSFMLLQADGRTP
jgi:hypothetical protein